MGASSVNYKKQGGKEWVIGNGGLLTVQSGGSIVLDSGGSVAGLGDTGVITVSNAELLALNATPKTFVAAQGANKLIVPILFVCKCVFVSAAFDGIASGEDLALRYTGTSGAVAMTVEATGFLDQGTDQTRYQGLGSTLVTPVANAPLVLHMTAGEIATGGGHLKCRLLYRVVDIALT